MSQLVRLRFLSHRRPAKAQASMRIRAISPEPSLFAHMKYGSKTKGPTKNQTSSPTGWLRMRVWKMNLRRTKSAIISWDGSNDKNLACLNLYMYVLLFWKPFYDVLAGYRGPKQKSPWIEYNGLEMGDSQLIINYLNKEFNVDLNKHLTSRERATAWAIQKWLEEFTYWWVLPITYTDKNFPQITILSESPSCEPTFHDPNVLHVLKAHPLLYQKIQRPRYM